MAGPFRRKTALIDKDSQGLPGTAHNDSFNTDEASAVSGNVLTNDSDPDGNLAVVAVNGSAANVGTTITLPSGALLTLNADGSFTYDPNHAFDATPTPFSGATNSFVQDKFSYTIEGGSTADVLVSITGLDSNDTLVVSNTASGGIGNDTYLAGIRDPFGPQILENPGEGFDAVYSVSNFKMQEGQEIEWLSTAFTAGTTAINLTGNEFNQHLIGNDGTNVLSGGGGADVMIGLSGNDTYFVDHAGDAIVETAGQGFDAVYANINFALLAGTEVEWLSTVITSGTGAINLIGNELNQYLTGNDGANVLSGGGGADVMIGLRDNDTYFVDHVGDAIVENGGQGFDAVYAAIEFALLAGQEVEWLSTVLTSATDAINLTGNELAQTLIGNDGVNALSGGGGADVMHGLAGNDTYFVDNAGDVVVENAGQGFDAVYSAISFTLAADDDVEWLSTSFSGGTGAIDLTGNNLAQTLIGNDGANILDGGTGSDTLYGLGGADSFAFTTALGAGNVDFFTDFVSGTDKILLDHRIFTGLSPGALNPDVFNGGGGNDGNDRIIFNPGLGFIYFDADGSGPGQGIAFALMQPGGTVTASDFVVI